MKYIISERQYNIISEALGVPDNILDAAEELYDVFLENLKSIDEKENEYNFKDDIDITLGDKKKINIDEYILSVEVEEYDEFDEHPQISSMGMGQLFKFNRELMMKEIDPSTEAQFSITFVANPNWEPHELFDEFNRNKEEHVASLAHELKHKYDKQSKLIDLLGHDAEYIGAQTAPRFKIPVIDLEFLHYIYYTNVAENLVRATEVASLLRSKKISQQEFREFLENNETFKKLVKIKNFTFEDLVNGISEHMDRVDEIIKQVGENPSSMDDEQKIDRILELVYINLSSAQMERFVDYIKGPMGGLFELFSFFGGLSSPEEIKVKKLKETFHKYLTRYKNDPTQFFKNQIEKFHVVANQMIKKLSKLYAMTSKSQTNESIINWELHMKLMEKKYGSKIKTKIDFI